MESLLVQLAVLVLAVCAAAIKSVRWPSKTDGRPLLRALQRLLTVFFTIAIVAILATHYYFVTAVALSAGWLLLAEVLAARSWLRTFAEHFAAKHHAKLVALANALRPLLRLMAEGRAPALAAPLKPTFHSKDQLLQHLNDTHLLTDQEKLLLHRGLRSNTTLIRDAMTPRAKVVTVGPEDTIGPLLLDRLHKAGYKSYPVVAGSFDHLQGILYMHDVTPPNPSFKHISEAMNPKLVYVHQDKPLEHALQAFLRTQQHLFIVVNEFEETIGVISIDNILEHVTGRPQTDEFSEYDDPHAVAQLVHARETKNGSARS